MAQPWRVWLYATEPTSTFLVGAHSLILIVGTSPESLPFNENSQHTTLPRILPRRPRQDARKSCGGQGEDRRGSVHLAGFEGDRPIPHVEHGLD